MDKLIEHSKNLIIRQSEELIIERAKKNPRDFKPLYEKYFDRIFRMVYQRTADKEIAADITSDVFYKALINIKKYTHKGHSIYSWIYRIAINECNEYFRKSGKTQYVVVEDADYIAISDDVGIDSDDREKILAAFGKLNDDDREVVRLRYFEEQSFKDIAELMGMTEANSKTRLYRAIDKLRKLIVG